MHRICEDVSEQLLGSGVRISPAATLRIASLGCMVSGDPRWCVMLRTQVHANKATIARNLFRSESNRLSTTGAMCAHQNRSSQPSPRQVPALNTTTPLPMYTMYVRPVERVQSLT